jgi:hypothetical protein
LSQDVALWCLAHAQPVMRQPAVTFCRATVRMEPDSIPRITRISEPATAPISAWNSQNRLYMRSHRTACQASLPSFRVSPNCHRRLQSGLQPTHTAGMCLAGTACAWRPRTARSAALGRFGVRKRSFRFGVGGGQIGGAFRCRAHRRGQSLPKVLPNPISTTAPRSRRRSSPRIRASRSRRCGNRALARRGSLRADTAVRQRDHRRPRRG